VLKLHSQSKLLEAGTDEAGRGCLAGPVFAAAVILPKRFKNKILNDSKQVSESNRDALRALIEKEAVSFAVAQIDGAEIDKINILKASIKAMHHAIGMLNVKPEFIIVDGNHFYPFPDIKHRCYVKGDGLFLNIAAASILAKTYRDEFMMQAHQTFPHYHWDKNKGYGTKSHVDAIREFGYSPLHRKTFVVKSLQQLNLF